MSLLELLEATAEYFRKSGVPSPRLDAELLIAHVLALPRLQLYLQFDRPMMKSDLDRLRPLVKRRARREPLQHLTGSVEFAGCTLTVSPAALIPRPETELLVDKLLARLSQNRPLRLVDVGTGSGAIALALARARPLATVIGIDVSPEALALAEANRQNLGLPNVRFQQGDLLSGIEGKADWVVANLPYLSAEEMESLEPEVRYDPPAALDGGHDGLEVIRRLLPQASKLAPNLALEIGFHHQKAALDLLMRHDYSQASVEMDLSGRPRFAFGWGSIAGC